MRLTLGRTNVLGAVNLKPLVQRRLGFVLGRFGVRIRAVTLSLIDTNAARGGVDKRCRVTVQLAPTGEIRVEEFDDKWEAAVTRAIDRIGRVVARRLGRWSDRRGNTAMGGPKYG